MPNDCLKRFSVRSHRFPVYHGHDHASVRNFCSVPTVPADNPTDCGANFPGIVKSPNDITADIAFHISTAYREHEDHVVCTKAAATKPLSVSGLPTLVIYSS